MLGGLKLTTTTGLSHPFVAPPNVDLPASVGECFE
jgi:hypothetical protein